MIASTTLDWRYYPSYSLEYFDIKLCFFVLNVKCKPQSSFSYCLIVILHPFSMPLKMFCVIQISKSALSINLAVVS